MSAARDTAGRLRELLAKAAVRPWHWNYMRDIHSGARCIVSGTRGSEMSDTELIVVLVNAAPAILDVVEAAAGAVYCADCVDNPEHNLCAKHLNPLRAAVARLDAAPGTTQETKP